MQKAKEEFRNEQRELLRVKEAHLKEICPPLQLDNLNDGDLNIIIIILRITHVQKHPAIWSL